MSEAVLQSWGVEVWKPEAGWRRLVVVEKRRRNVAG